MVLPYLRAYLAERGAAPKASSGLQLQDLVVASPPPSQAALQVTRWRWDALRQEIQFYLRCSTPQICRPFLATARPRDDEVLAALRAVAPGGAPAAPSPFANAGIKTSLPHEARLIRTGEHVRLLLAGPNIRIQLAAICLEPGGLGQRVRVRGIGDTKVFLARVMGPGWLAAEFP
jgi:flagella basal body P-ring formation protein FlgA